MLGRLDLERCECPRCNGTGKDPKNRKRNCPLCYGNGLWSRCKKCGGYYEIECVDPENIFDVSYCSGIRGNDA